MKRFFAIFSSLFAAAASFAQSWESNAGVGLSVPYSKIGVDERGAGDISQLCFGAEGFYLGYHENGFTVKGDYTVALTTTKDINLQNHQTNAGFFMNTAIGAGYSFTPDEKWLLSFTMMVGADISLFTDSDETVTYEKDYVRDNKADYDRSFSMVTLNLGADILTRYKMGEHFGVFASLSARYIIGGWGTDETTYTFYNTSGSSRSKDNDKTSTDTDLLGYFRVQPTLGVCWTF